MDINKLKIGIINCLDIFLIPKIHISRKLIQTGSRQESLFYPSAHSVFNVTLHILIHAIQLDNKRIKRRKRTFFSFIKGE